MTAAPDVWIYPERKDALPTGLDAWGAAASGIVTGTGRRLVAPLRDRLDLRAVLRAMARLEAAPDAPVTPAARARIRRRGLDRSAAREALALAADAVRRELGFAPRRVQLLGALAMLRGRLIEMDTGEGKTVTAALAAAAAALAGIPVHVVTVNDYLAERDARTLGPVYNRLGLSVAAILEGQEPATRRAIYRSDIVYGANNEFAFDYLRDRIGFGAEGPQGLRQRLRRVTAPDMSETPAVMRGLHFAIVDEADSVLVDEARTPLIISRRSDPEAEADLAHRALAVARALQRHRHFTLIEDERRIRLTSEGRAEIGRMTAGDAAPWTSVIRREELARQALTALLVFHAGEHYVVAEGKIQIVDEYTGRLQPDRSWSDGMHQLVEAKEGVEITGQNIAVARMTYQRFFRRYRLLAGMTGTAREVTGELFDVYGLATVRIRPHRRSRLRSRRTRYLRTQKAKWQAVVASAAAEAAKGRPVLIGTRSVSASQTVSAALDRAGLAHRVLNAQTEAESAEIIAGAGQSGQVTVATNMAGRGVDIALGPGVAAKGGLHVILTERHDAGRIDRQLAGRAGRRGEAGSHQAILSLQDPLLDVLAAPALKMCARLPLIGLAPRQKLFRRAQRRAERSHARMRRDLVRQDQRLGQLLAFTGGLE